MINSGDIKKFMDKVKQAEAGHQLDLSSDEDLSIAIMNLISIEEHLFFTGNKTGKTKYFDLLNEAREMRKTLLKEIIKDYEGEVWCLPPDSIVYGNPEPKPISDVKTNDKTLSHKGKFSRVKRTYVRDYIGDLISVSPYYADPLRLTPNHEILCATGVKKKQQTLWKKNFVQPALIWKKAESIDPSDFLIFPRYQEENDINELEISYSWTNSGCFKPTSFSQRKKIKVDDKLLKLIGLYISEGSIYQGKYLYKGSTKTQFTLYFSFGKHEHQLIKYTEKLFRDIFGETLKRSETHTTIDLVCAKRIIAQFFKQFGCRSKEKQLPDWIVQLPQVKLFPLIWGLVKGDGNEDKYQISYFTSSQKLAYQLRLILFKLGVIHSLHWRRNDGGFIGNRKIKPSNYFVIGISGDSARLLHSRTNLKYIASKTSGNFGHILRDYVMIPIKKVERTFYSGKVYNFQTEDETYTTHTGVVHNCTSKHLLAASMRLFEVGTKAQTKGDTKKAHDFFKKSYDLYNLFWGINLGMVKKVGATLADAQKETPISYQKSDFLGKISGVIGKILDCCRE